MKAFFAYFLKFSVSFLVLLFFASLMHHKRIEKQIDAALVDEKSILLGDSHAAQLDLPNCHEISAAGSSLYLPYFFLKKNAPSIPKEKVICISLWHENLNTDSEHSSLGNFSGVKGLKKYAEASTILGIEHLLELPKFKSRILFLLASLSFQSSILNNTGTCFEGRFKGEIDFSFAEKSFNSKNRAITAINSIAKRHGLKLLWVISPQISTSSKAIQEKNSIIDSILTPDLSRNVQILDLRKLELPMSSFRDMHHINCDSRDTINYLFKRKLTEF